MNLKELICPKLILCDVDAKDFQDALRQMAGHLKKEGYVEEGYLDMLLERERKFPTGLCTKPFCGGSAPAPPTSSKEQNGVLRNRGQKGLIFKAFQKRKQTG